MKNLTNLTLILCIVACQPKTQQNASRESEAIIAYEAITLLGDTLYNDVSRSRANYLRNSGDPDALIWYGRRTAYAGQFQDAIRIYTEGIDKFPDDARMYRHRGHRYISTRQYDNAIADFEKAASLIEGTEDQVEPDGQPNEKNIPLSTLHGNIWYHLGLAYYLKNDMENALRAYSNRTVTERYDDNIVSGGHWLYMISRRLGKVDEANTSIEKVNPDMEIIENTSYYKMCLFYKGLMSEEELLPQGDNSASNDVFSYSLANWYLYDQQDTAMARSYYENLFENGNPYSFAYLAGESDWNRLFK